MKKEETLFNALKEVSKAVVGKANSKPNWPAGVYFDSEGKLWFRNKHWTFEELATTLKRVKNG